MTNVSLSNVSTLPVFGAFTWDNEENAKKEFFARMEARKAEIAAQQEEQDMQDMSNMENEGGMHPVTPAQQEEQEEQGEREEETFPPHDEQEEQGAGVDVNDPLAPYADELLNICFKGAYGVQIDFVQRKGSEARQAVKVLQAQQKGKFALTIQRIIETEGDTEYKDIVTIAPSKGQGSSVKGAKTSSASPKGKTPEQIAEIERKKEEKRLEDERKAQEKAAKVELRQKMKDAAELDAALKAARNAPAELNNDGEPNKALMQFNMLHRPQGATYGELGAASNIVNGGWKTTLKGFARSYNKVILAQYRQCAAKPGIKTYAAYRLIDNNPSALANIPQGWVIDPNA